MSKGSFVEVAEGHALFETPQRMETKAYVLDCLQLEERSRGKNLRNAFHTGKSVFDM